MLYQFIHIKFTKETHCPHYSRTSKNGMAFTDLLTLTLAHVQSMCTSSCKLNQSHHHQQQVNKSNSNLITCSVAKVTMAIQLKHSTQLKHVQKNITATTTKLSASAIVQVKTAYTNNSVTFRK